MKEVVCLVLPELEEAVMRLIASRPSHVRKFVGAIEFFVDPTNPKEELRIRANVALFNTQAMAHAYHEELVNPKKPEEKSDGAAAAQGA